VLSPLYIIADEVLHVRVRSKHRMHLYSESYSDSHARVSFPVRTLSPSYHGIRTSLSSLSQPSNPDGSSAPLAKLKRTASLSPTVGITHGATAAQRQAHERLQRKSGGMTIQLEGSLKRRGSYSGVSVATGGPPSISRSTSNSSSREILQPSPSPLAAKGLASSTSSLAQDYEFLSPEESYFTPGKGKASSADDGEGTAAADASTGVSSTLDLPSPASVGSAKKGKPKLNFVDLSDSGSFTTSPVSCEARASFSGVGDDDEKAEGGSESSSTPSSPPDVTPLAKANRRISLKTHQGAKLIFSPLAVGLTKVAARSFSSEEAGNEEKEKDE
jgi:hypothetical protein